MEIAPGEYAIGVAVGPRKLFTLWMRRDVLIGRLNLVLWDW